jgi:hypothetical protein
MLNEVLASEQYLTCDRHTGTQQYATTQLMTLTRTWVTKGLGTYIMQLYTTYVLVSYKKNLLIEQFITKFT